MHVRSLLFSSLLTMAWRFGMVTSFGRRLVPWASAANVKPNLSSTGANSYSSCEAFSTEKRKTALRAVSVARDSLAETTKTGEFKRTDSIWRNWISRGTHFAPCKTSVLPFSLPILMSCPMKSSSCFGRGRGQVPTGSKPISFNCRLCLSVGSP
jgi:hypothetical protein